MTSHELLMLEDKFSTAEARTNGVAICVLFDPLVVGEEAYYIEGTIYRYPVWDLLVIWFDHPEGFPYRLGVFPDGSINNCSINLYMGCAKHWRWKDECTCTHKTSTEV